MATIKITKITSQKDKERINLYSDDDFIVGIDRELLIEHGLAVGTELDERLLELLETEDEVKKCLNKAYRYLSYRPRSEQEVFKKLLEKYPETVVEKAMVKLKSLHYVDDQAFVNFWLEARGNSRGPALLRSELLQKGVERSLIEEALGKNPDDKQVEDAILLVGSKKRYHGLERQELYKKVAPFLARRGYSFGTIKKAIDHLEEKD